MATKIALLGCIASLCFSFLVFPDISRDVRANPDPDRFGEVAWNIARGNGFVYEKGGSPILERAPFYSYIVAGLFAVTGTSSVTPVQIFQALLHGLTSMLVFLVLSGCCSPRTAMLGQLAVALHPVLIWYTARIWVETTNTFLLAALCYVLILLVESPALRRGIGAGVIIGVSSLTKSVLLAFPIVVVLLLIMRCGTRGVGIGLAMMLATVLVVSPWTIRNYAVSDRFIPVNTSLGFNLVQGNVIGDYWPEESRGILAYWKEGNARADSVLSPHGVSWESPEGDRILMQFAADRLVHAPAYALWRLVANGCTFWFLSESTAKSVFLALLQFPMLAGAVISIRNVDPHMRNRLLPVLLLVAYYFLVHAAVVGWGRYSAPIIPMLIMLAAPLIDKTIQRSSRWRFH